MKQSRLVAFSLFVLITSTAHGQSLIPFEDPVPPAPQSATQAQGQIFYTTADDYPIRTKAGTEAEDSIILAHVSKNTPLKLLDQVYDQDGDLWYKVYVNAKNKKGEEYNIIGFIYSKRAIPASDVVQTPDDTEACPDCFAFIESADPKPTAKADSEEILEEVDNEPTGFKLNSRRFVRSCGNFINADGLGRWGEILIDAVNRIAPSCFYDSSMFERICPNYQSLSKKKKNALIALTFAAIAKHESTCNPEAQNPNGSNDIADGLFQLEYSYPIRAQAGRNRRWCRTSDSTDTQDLTFQMECSVSIVEDTVCANGRNINYNSGYWQELRGNGSITQDIKRQVKGWGICD